MGLQAEIWAWRLGGGTKKKEKEKKEKIPHMCESIGHRPLWGRCPKKREKSQVNQYRMIDTKTHDDSKNS